MKKITSILLSLAILCSFCLVAQAEDNLNVEYDSFLPGYNLYESLYGNDNKVEDFKNLPDFDLSQYSTEFTEITASQPTESESTNATEPSESTLVTEATESTYSQPTESQSTETQPTESSSATETEPTEDTVVTEATEATVSQPTESQGTETQPTESETTKATDASHTTEPTGSQPTESETTTPPTESESTKDTAVTIPTESESTDITEPTYTTEPTETTSDTTPTETTPTESESTEPTTSEKPTETQKPTQASTDPKLNKAKVSLKAGETFTLKVSNTKGARVRFTSSNTKIATVSSSGIITALKKGTVKIIANINGKKLTCTVKVTTTPKLELKGKKVTSVKVKKGKFITLNLTGKAKAIKNVYTNTAIAQIISKPTAKKLKIKGLKKGTTTLKIKVNNVKTIKLKVKVK